MNEEEESFFTDELDHAILMHRDAHFGGSFDVMLQYYQNEGIGVHDAIDIDRIYYLAACEKQVGQDLSPLVLDQNEMEQVENARTAYLELKKLYEQDASVPLPRLIADLILSEEEEPLEEINAIVQMGKNATPELLALLKSESAYDPLFPGYGYAPYLATLCLAQIPDERAIIPLFESLNRESIFGVEATIEALVRGQTPAQEFLLKILHSRPRTRDNINAALVLSAFPPSESIAEAALAELKDPDNWHDHIFCSYLLIAVDALKDKSALLSLSQELKIPSFLKKEIEQIIK